MSNKTFAEITTITIIPTIVIEMVTKPHWGVNFYIA